jgi:hypothetical protein
VIQRKQSPDSPGRVNWWRFSGDVTGLGGRNLEMRDRGLTIDEVIVILGVEHGGLDVGSCEPDDGGP